MGLESDFDQAMRGTYEAARARGYVPTYFLQMIEQFGGVETAHRLLDALQVLQVKVPGGIVESHRLSLRPLDVERSAP